MKLPSPTQRQPYRYRTPNSLGHGACLDTYGNDTTTNAGFIGYGSMRFKKIPSGSGKGVRKEGQKRGSGKRVREDGQRRGLDGGGCTNTCMFMS